tara:strand:- start:5073 stop:5399 length:327 start_codon:yes stop_codon:yes gene_type:complete
MMTEGDSRYIKRHTEKTFRELNIKGVTMKPTKKKPAKKAYRKDSLIGKLLQLKYRINDTASEEGGWSTDMQSDKSWVMNLISDVRVNNINKLCKEDLLKCNSLWRSYE